MQLRGFASDNQSGAHPRILRAIGRVNSGHVPSYGADPITQAAVKLLRKHFGPRADIYFVFNGTGGNVSSLRTLCKRFQSIVCADTAHLAVDECGAPEAIIGSKLVLLPHVNGKVTPENLKKVLVRKGDPHFSQPHVLAITQPTELGTCYSIEELKTLFGMAKKHGLKIMIDGSRLPNACVTLGKSFRELTFDLGADVVVLGGTKNGFIFGEAVIFREPQPDFAFLQKQSLQLPSKGRFVAAQFVEHFKDGLWKKIATHSTRMAQLMRKCIERQPEARIIAPVQSNAVFAELPLEWIPKLQKKFPFYVWLDGTNQVRLMTSWDTQPSDIVAFEKEINRVRKQRA